MTPDYSLYICTDTKLAGERGNLAAVKLALEGGATVVQLREKEMSTRGLIELGAAIQQLCREHGALFIVNDRVDVALALDADGIHVGQDDMPCLDARRLVGPEKIVGVSATTLDEAIRAARDGADYLGVGPVYYTGTKLDAAPVTGVALVAAAKRETGLPVVAIGGINAANAAEIVAAGADGVAVISAVLAASDPQAAAAGIREIVAGAKR
jgi:thiamine-phosphate pyrophosphorylase